MNRFFMIAALLLCSGCVTKPPLNADGYYRFVQDPIEVKPPFECVPELSFTQSPHAVDFHLGAGYWRVFGLYAVQVFPIPADVHDADTFMQRTARFAPDYVANDRSNLEISFKFTGGRELDWSRPAYRAIGQADEAVFITTFMLHESRITAASLVFPLKEQHGRPVPMECYEAFAKSVSESPDMNRTTGT